MKMGGVYTAHQYNEHLCIIQRQNNAHLYIICIQNKADQ